VPSIHPRLPARPIRGGDGPAARRGRATPLAKGAIAAIDPIIDRKFDIPEGCWDVAVADRDR